MREIMTKEYKVRRFVPVKDTAGMGLMFEHWYSTPVSYIYIYIDHCFQSRILATRLFLLCFSHLASDYTSGGVLAFKSHPLNWNFFVFSYTVQ